MEAFCSKNALKNAGSLVAVGLRAIAIAARKRRENYTINGRKTVEKPIAFPL